MVFFGEPSDYMREIAIANDASYSTLEGKANIGRMTDQSQSPQEAIVLTPQTGLIGVPVQTQDGISFRCLLNPNIKVQYPPMLVKLDMQQVQQQKVYQNQL